MDWAKDFYSVTGRWWASAEAPINAVHRWRAGLVSQLAPAAATALDLGCGYGSTCLALADVGLRVCGIDLSDRVDDAHSSTERTNPTFVKDDFFTYNFGQRFDVVTYWDGFGIGTDEDQLAVLNLIERLLEPAGIAIVEVYDPLGWQQDDGLDEVKTADPARGYHHSLRHQRSFDNVSSRAIDTWTDLDDGIEWSQSLRCYSSAEFEQLVDRSNLATCELLTEGQSAWSYLTVLHPSGKV